MPQDKIENIYISNSHEEQSSVFDWESYRVAYFILKNKEKSSKNEDSLFFRSWQDRAVFGIADGAGGHPRGSDAASIALEILKNKKLFPKNLLGFIDKVNTGILNLKAGARSTIAVVTAEQAHLSYGSVGDSEIIHWNSNGQQIYSNIPQSDTGYGIEAGLISQEDSLDNPDRYLVSTLLGDEFVRVEATTRVPIKKGHTVIVGSDGLFDNLAHSQLAEKLTKGNFNDCVEDLFSYCRSQDQQTWKKDDDISFFLLRKLRS